MGAIQARPAAPKTTAPAAPQAAARPAAAPQQQPQQRNPGGFNAAKPRGVRQFLKAIALGESAEYILRVNKCVQVWTNPKAVDDDRPQPTPEELRTSKPAYKKKDAFTYEAEVIESGHPQIKAGAQYSITTTDKYVDSYFADIKGFLCAVTGKEPEDETLFDDWARSYKPDQPFAGTLIHVTVHEQKNRDNDGTFTKVIPRALTQEEYDAVIAENPHLAAA
jgi:hypothetical protein